MNKINITTSAAFAKNEYLKWLINSRMIILSAIFLFIYVFAVLPLLENSELMNDKLNMVEPYIAALNSGLLLLIIPLGFLAVSSDFPRTDNALMFLIFRIGRINWFVGQLISLFMMSVSYLVLVFLAAAFPVLLNSETSNDWSKTTLEFAYEFPQFSQNFGAQLLPKNLYLQMSVLQALVQSSLFTLLYLIMLGTVQLAFTIAGQKKAGLIACGGLIAIGTTLCSIRSEAMWVFPMANSIVWLHYTEFRRMPIYPIWCSTLYFIGIIAALLIISVIKLKKFNCV